MDRISEFLYGIYSAILSAGFGCIMWVHVRREPALPITTEGFRLADFWEARIWPYQQRSSR